MNQSSATYPLSVELDAPLEVARWRPLAAWLLAIPHLIVIEALQLVAGCVTFVAFFAILFTGQYPVGMFNIVVMTHRYSWRSVSYLLWMRESYPPFEFENVAEDPGGDPAPAVDHLPGDDVSRPAVREVAPGLPRQPHCRVVRRYWVATFGCSPILHVPKLCFSLPVPILDTRDLQRFTTISIKI